MPIPPIIILALIMCGTAIVLATMIVVSLHLAQRRRTSRALSTEEIARRLERIEQAIDTTAIEVERLAESNRFVAKLLAERTDASRS